MKTIKQIKSSEDYPIPQIGDPVNTPEIVEPLEYKIKRKRGRPKKIKQN